MSELSESTASRNVPIYEPMHACMHLEASEASEALEALEALESLEALEALEALEVLD